MKIIRKCEHCGGSMHGIRKGAKFCGNSCRQSAYQKRNYIAKPKATRPKQEG